MIGLVSGIGVRGEISGVAPETHAAPSGASAPQHTARTGAKLLDQKSQNAASLAFSVALVACVVKLIFSKKASSHSLSDTPRPGSFGPLFGNPPSRH